MGGVRPEAKTPIPESQRGAFGSPLSPNPPSAREASTSPEAHGPFTPRVPAPGTALRPACSERAVPTPGSCPGIDPTQSMSRRSHAAPRLRQLVDGEGLRCPGGEEPRISFGRARGANPSSPILAPPGGPRRSPLACRSARYSLSLRKPRPSLQDPGGRYERPCHVPLPGRRLETGGETGGHSGGKI